MKSKKMKLVVGLMAFIVVASLAACNGNPPYGDNPNNGGGNGTKDSVWVGPYRDTLGH